MGTSRGDDDMLDQWTDECVDTKINNVIMKLKIFRDSDYHNTIDMENDVNEFIIDLQKRCIPNQMTTLEHTIYVLFKYSGGDQN
jgi:hypothetical protein